MGSPYTAPASRVFTKAHILAETEPAEDGEPGVERTRCGQLLAAEELWVRVELCNGDQVCPKCQGITDEQGTLL